MINKVSIIVPVYNTEKYLDRCIESIINQSYSNIEIIIIDDGSNDECSKKCDIWKEKDSRIKVIHKRNEGLGEARNSGIRESVGDYVCFVDSDDYVEQSLVEECVDKAVKHNLDIVTYGFFDDLASGEIKERIPHLDKKIYIKDEVRESFLPKLIANGISGRQNNLQMSLCASFIRRDLIIENGWKSESERRLISEDIYSLLELYSYVNSVGIVNKSFYHYCENNTSLSRKYKRDRFEKNMYCYKECLALCETVGYSDKIKDCVADQFFSNIIGMLKLCVKQPDTDEKKVIREMINDDNMKKILQAKKKYPDTGKRKILLFVMNKKMINLCNLLIKKSIRE